MGSAEDRSGMAGQRCIRYESVCFYRTLKDFTAAVAVVVVVVVEDSSVDLGGK